MADASGRSAKLEPRDLRPFPRTGPASPPRGHNKAAPKTIKASLFLAASPAFFVVEAACCPWGDPNPIVALTKLIGCILAAAPPC